MRVCKWKKTVTHAWASLSTCNLISMQACRFEICLVFEATHQTLLLAWLLHVRVCLLFHHPLSLWENIHISVSSLAYVAVCFKVWLWVCSGALMQKVERTRPSASLPSISHEIKVGHKSLHNRLCLFYGSLKAGAVFSPNHCQICSSLIKRGQTARRSQQSRARTELLTLITVKAWAEWTRWEELSIDSPYILAGSMPMNMCLFVLLYACKALLLERNISLVDRKCALFCHNWWLGKGARTPLLGKIRA